MTSDTTQQIYTSKLPAGLKGGLYSVATPIGNLKDITLRALEVLEHADMLLCEDTRVTRKLLSHYGLNPPMRAYHEHNAVQQREGVLALLRAGKAVALVSDAGTPLMSDPGADIVEAAHAEGIPVYPIPGASALVVALSASGMPAVPSFFAGFLPTKAKALRDTLQSYQSIPGTLVFYERASRLKNLFTAIGEMMGDRQLILAREMTKQYESFVRGTAGALIAQLEAGDIPEKGECVVLVAPPPPQSEVSDAQLVAQLETLIKSGESVKEAVALLTKQSGCPRNRVYTLALSLKDAGKA
ncbi:MAG: 16S rRNA (cytidine(1402)-2'-O)-methyltransferase [Hyphomicrobiales bacterium]|nr:16S rRNA (cytidine(1402)-2'-O)-methyltransferase [Hyphomicrobiales bacterium]